MTDSVRSSGAWYGRARGGAIAAIVAVIYFLAARYSLLLAVGESNATSVWPPSGIAFAAVLLWGYRMGPGIFLGALAANVLALQIPGVPLAHVVAASLATAAGNALEGIVGVYLLGRVIKEGGVFDSVRSYFLFTVLGCLVATMISASVGVSAFCTLSDSWAQAPSFWLTWWLGDAVGIAVVTPLIVLWYGSRRFPIRARDLLEMAGVLLVLGTIAFLVFRSALDLDFMIIPVLLWIAFRHGRRAAAVAVFVVSVVAVAYTIVGTGPRITSAVNRSLLYLQSYLGVIAILTLCVSVLTRERGRSEERRSVVEKQLYDIIDFLPDATFAIDVRGTVIAWNRAIESLTGIPKREMMGRGGYAYAVPFFGDARPILIDYVLQEGGPPDSSAYDYFNRHERIVFAERFNPILGRYLAGAASALLDARGNTIGAIESIRDISERKNAEIALKHYQNNLEEMVALRSTALKQANDQLVKEIDERNRIMRALEASERKYRDLVEGANSVILRWKTDGTVSFFNTYAQRYFGYSAEEIIGRNIIGTIVPAHETSGRDLAALMDELAHDPGSHVLNENENIKQNGERVWIAWTNRPVYDEDGSLVEILSVGTDITARKQMEESLRNALDELAKAKEQAEAADRLKSAFLATMSHELRTPLNSIIGFTGILMKKLAGPLTAEQEKQLGMVQASARHLLSLINDVLDISKIEAGQLQISDEVFDARAAVVSVVEALRPLADRKNLALGVSIGADVGMMRGDQRRVEQVLMNLLSNAIKFTDAGAVAVSADIVTSASDGRAIRFSVADSGIGIDADDLHTLFQPFRQIDTGLSRKSEGTGLGLAICRRLSELMDGSIVVESEKGRGSTFSFSVPLREES